MTLDTILAAVTPSDALAILAAFALKGALLFLLAAIIAGLMRRASASARHAVWALALAGALVLPVLFATLPGWKVAVLPSDNEHTVLIAPLAPEAPTAPAAPAPPRTLVAPVAPLPPRAPSDLEAHLPEVHAETHVHIDRDDAGITIIERHTLAPLPPTPAPPASHGVASVLDRAQAIAAYAFPPALQSWQLWIVLAWFAGVVFFVSRWVLAVFGAWRLVRDAEPVYDLEWLEMKERIAYGLDLDDRVRLLRSDRLGVPVAGGILDPVVVLPADADTWPEERREVVLTHELAHIARRDCLTQTVAQWSVALHWFNPLAWYAHKQYLLEREHACDDYVLNHGTAPSDYAEHLLQIARRFRRESLALSATAPMARRSNLEHRITSILNPERRRAMLGRAALATGTFLALALVLPLAAFHPVEKAIEPRDVQFASFSVSPAKVFASPLPKPSYSVAQMLSGDETFEWEGRVQAGGFVEVRGINGTIRARTGSGDRVRVEAEKSSRRGQEGTVEIVVNEFANGVVVCAVYPGQRNECAPGSSSSGDTKDNDVTVTFDVTIPDNVRFVGRTVNGDVTTGTLGADAELSTVNGSIRSASRGGNIDATTVNGSIEAEAAGLVRAGTVNGSIDARLGRADWSGDLEFKTVNGSVTLDLPTSLNTTVEAKTQTGRIRSDFPLEIDRNRYVGSQARGTIGSGGRHLDLEVLNGSIKLQRSSGTFGSSNARFERDREHAARDEARLARDRERIERDQARLERWAQRDKARYEAMVSRIEERARQDQAQARKIEAHARRIQNESLDLVGEALADIGPVMALVMDEAGRALAEIDFRGEIEAAFDEIDWAEIETTLEEAEREMEWAEREMERAMREVEREMERAAEACEEDHEHDVDIDFDFDDGQR